MTTLGKIVEACLVPPNYSEGVSFALPSGDKDGEAVAPHGQEDDANEWPRSGDFASPGVVPHIPDSQQFRAGDSHRDDVQHGIMRMTPTPIPPEGQHDTVGTSSSSGSALILNTTGAIAEAVSYLLDTSRHF